MRGRPVPDLGPVGTRCEATQRRHTKMRFSALVSVLHSVGPVVIGVSLGFTLSLLCVSWTDEACYSPGEEGEGLTLGRDGPPRGARKPSSVSNGHDTEPEEDFEPRIVPYKQVQPSSPKKVFRQVPSLKSTGDRQRMYGVYICSKSESRCLRRFPNHLGINRR